MAGAIVRVFVAQGDRTDRQKARLKYVLDRMGHDAFVTEVEKDYGAPLRRVGTAGIAPRPAVDKQGHVGVHGQKQAGRKYLGSCCRWAASRPARCVALPRSPSASAAARSV